MERAGDSASSDPSTDRAALTTALLRLSGGDTGADADLASLLYVDMRRLAGSLLRSERRDHTLQPTALVNEAWLRLVDETVFDGMARADARRCFLAYAARAMRRILIEHARARHADRRGGDRQRVPLAETLAWGATQSHELLDLDDALRQLADERPRAAQVAELRVYGGLSTAEAAEVVDVSLATAKADWALAKAVLTLKVRGPRDPA